MEKSWKILLPTFGPQRRKLSFDYFPTPPNINFSSSPTWRPPEWCQYLHPLSWRWGPRSMSHRFLCSSFCPFFHPLLLLPRIEWPRRDKMSFVSGGIANDNETIPAGVIGCFDIHLLQRIVSFCYLREVEGVLWYHTIRRWHVRLLSFIACWVTMMRGR